MSAENGEPEGVIRAERIDALCDEFEAAWRDGQRPDLQNWLQRIEPAWRPAALAELMRVELEFRRRRDERPDADEYRQSLPQLRDVVNAVFTEDGSDLTGALDPSAKRPGSGLRVRCPHCHNPIELLPDAPLDQVDCPSCGSSFCLSRDDAATHDAGVISQLGQFELIERLGMGAFGTVWKARDTELGRSVAVKVPRRGSLDSIETEKFLREARSMAQLRHPNIVPVHEIGREDDTLYIVSDYIRGVPLSQTIADSRMTFREAAELLIKVAGALHHAHEKGIVHRDLKPQNIMLDDAAEPHLMDFGLAKREAGEITMTLDGDVLGTPAYMSPEQARGEAHKVDRTSDIYSLGVIMFQLLTGELPFRGTAQMFVHKVINNEPPSPRRMDTRIPRDLETICLKCLDKDPKRRYATAALVAEELRRYLAGQPIQARPIGRMTRAGRWVHKNPLVSSLALAVALSLVAGTIISVYFAIDAQRQAALALRTADEKTELAVRNQSVVDFFVSAFESANPESAGATVHLTAREVLERALARITSDKGLESDPLTRATLLEALGLSLHGLGAYDQAISAHKLSLELRERHLKDEHCPDTLTSMHNLGTAYKAAGRVEAALPLYEQTLQLSKAKLGEEHPYTLHFMNSLAAAYEAAGRLDEAITLYEQTLQLSKANLGDDHPDTLRSMNDLGDAYRNAGRPEEAIPLLEQTLRLRKAKMGDEHPATLTSMNNLAAAYEAAGRLEDALPLFEQTLQLLKAQFGDEHPHSLSSMNNLAVAYQDGGRLAEAILLHEQTLQLRKAKLDDEHPHTLLSMNNLAGTYKAAGRLEEALALHEQTLQLRKTKLGDGHPATLTSINNLAEVLLMAKQFRRCREVAADLVAHLQQKDTPDQRMLTGGYISLAEALVGLERMAEATKYIGMAVEAKELSNIERFRANSIRGSIFAAEGDWDQAEPLLVESAKSLSNQLATMKISFRWYASRACERVIGMYQAWGKTDEAAKWKARLDEVNAEIERLRNYKMPNPH